MNFRQAFIHWYFNEFRIDPLYVEMSNVTEDSPHHRERDVGTHTDMVVAAYLGQTGPVWGMDDLLGALAVTFHDVGKPLAKEEVFKEDRGWYKRFAGHETISARLWEDWAVRNWSRLGEFDIDAEHLHAVGWMIEYHLPWRLKDTTKRRRLALTANHILETHGTFNSVLMADAIGRICDDDKIGESVEWCRNFTQLCVEAGRGTMMQDNGQPILYVPIAASGAGKSTFIHDLVERASEVDRVIDTYSWDTLRLEWYLSDEERLSIQSQAEADLAYKAAFERQMEDTEEFTKRSNAHFVTMVKEGNSIALDNTNLTKKRRRFFIDQAHRNGFWVQAVLFPISLQTVIDRQATRTDKTVPISAVQRHYMSLQLPQYGEFDDIWTITGNLPVD